MADIFTIPNSNILRFVRTNQSDLQNFQNTLYYSERYPHIYPECYFQKITIGDEINIQYITNYSTITIKSYDENGDEQTDYSGSITTLYTYTDTSGNVIYQLDVDTSALSGYYYFIITATGTGKPDLVFRSEAIYIANHSTIDTIKVEYYNDIDSDLDDGIYYTGAQNFIFQLDARLRKYEPGAITTIYNNFNNVPTKLEGLAEFYVKLEVDPCPRYIMEKLNLALQHENLLFNDVEYQTEEKLKIEPTGELDMYSGEVMLRLVNYEDYSYLVDQGGSVDTNILLIDGTDQFLINATDSILIND